MSEDREYGDGGSRSVVPYDPEPSLITRGLALADELTRSGGNLRIVIVDDILETRNLLAKLISDEQDMEVVGLAGDGKEALDVVMSLSPDIVLMDIYMPVMDGITATEILAADADAPAIIMMSVQADQDFLHRARLAGATEYIVKPFSVDELVAAIRLTAEVQHTRKPGRAGGVQPRMRATRPTVEASDMPPCNLLLAEDDLPPGFIPWGDRGPIDYHEATAKHCYRIFTNGPRPATESAVIWAEVAQADAEETAGTIFERWTNGVREEWSGSAHYGTSLTDLAVLPRAAEFVPIQELNIETGDESRAYEATMAGRRVVWAYVRVDRIIWGIRAHDVAAPLVVALVAHMARKSRGGAHFQVGDDVWDAGRRSRATVLGIVPRSDYENDPNATWYHPEDGEMFFVEDEDGERDLSAQDDLYPWDPLLADERNRQAAEAAVESAKLMKALRDSVQRAQSEGGRLGRERIE